MLIDWFTVCAQGVNFLVLVWLLKRFLYKPILAAIAAREKRVATEVADAEANAARTLADRADLARKAAAFDAGAASRLAQSVLDAGNEKERLLQLARAADARLREDDASALRGERGRLGAAVAARAAQEVGRISRQALQQLANADLEQAMVGEFLRRLAALGPELRSALSAGLRAPGAAALIRTSHDLAEAARASIQDGLNRALSAAVPVAFQVDGTVICGIELDLGGQRMGWSLAEYLRGLERDTAGLIAAGTIPRPVPPVTAIPVPAAEPVSSR